MADVPLELLHLTIKSDIERELLLRAGRAMEYLVGKIKQAYRESLTVQSGESGSVGGIVAETRKGRELIESVIGVTKAAHYLANIDLGERGTEGGPSDTPFQRKKAPPVRAIHRWLSKGNITVPAYYTGRAERNKNLASAKRKPAKFDAQKPWYSDDPAILYAFDIAQKRKRLGRVGLKLFEKTAKEQAEKIRKYLEGA